MESGEWVAVDVGEMHISPKRERSPDPEDVPEWHGNKRQAGEESAVIRAPVVFPWRTCQDRSDVERLKIKEKAVKHAEELCSKIREILKNFLKTTPMDNMDAIIMGQKIIEHWFSEHDRIRLKHQKLRILVGVEGPTGAGKSSFLGSLLGIPELFPSGQEAAATAVIGKVCWNWIDAPGYEFRAKVIFRKKSDVERDLESLLKDLNELASLLAEKAKYEHGGGTEFADSISIMRKTIEHHLPKVHAVWGIEEAYLSEMAKRCPEDWTYPQMVQRILSTNPKALGFLTTGIAEFNADSSDKLSETIKPFLDSTAGKHGGAHQFAAWPLVKEVRIYAKADILKSGITLVDLPGCGDAVENRSEVAEKYTHRLDVRLVVSPIIRAADEKQGQALMRNGYDEAQMRISGKLDNHGFGVIISKMDDIKFDSYIAQCPDLRRNSEVKQNQEELVKLKEESDELKPMYAVFRDNKKRAESQKKKGQKTYRSAKKKHEARLQTHPNESGAHVAILREQRDRLAKAFEEADKAMDRYELRKLQIATQMSYVRDWLHHRAVQTRNARVMQRIRTDFDRRQRSLDEADITRRPQREEEYVLPILPVSTRAFWQLRSNDVPMSGFPNQRFTGVPAAVQWLHRATSGKREKHLDEVLEGYQNLMTMMQIYSSPNGQDGRFDFTRAQVEEILAETHAKYLHQLSTTLSNSCDEIQKLDPLERKDHARKRFLKDANRIVQKWGYKYPDIENDVEKMHWCTYAANLSRDGSKFKSHATGVTYTWMEHLVAPIMKTFSKDWDRKMNRQLPLIKTPMILGYSQGFTQYLNEIQQIISDKVPSLELSFNSMRPILENSQHATEIKIRDALSVLQENVARVAFLADEYMADEWKPTFRIALLDTGIGSYQRRKDINEDKAMVPSHMEQIVDEEVNNVKQQMSFLFNNLVENYATSPEKSAMKTQLQDSIRPYVEGWEAVWAEEGNLPEHILDRDLSIPPIVPVPVIEEDIPSENDDDASSEDELAAVSDGN
ncbi:GTPase SLIP-GC [Fusarium beomiforme]|uniref:GTPase SLIP-GC n=1 Tax=Fusarium beomiforme TaxID=44412 RepID=A0A9P5DV72_9HYPO|nr:GTPase SLIP-GC [Fusarium beomiforme]